MTCHVLSPHFLSDHNVKFVKARKILPTVPPCPLSSSNRYGTPHVCLTPRLAAPNLRRGLSGSHFQIVCSFDQVIDGSSPEKVAFLSQEPTQWCAPNRIVGQAAYLAGDSESTASLCEIEACGDMVDSGGG